MENQIKPEKSTIIIVVIVSIIAIVFVVPYTQSHILALIVWYTPAKFSVQVLTILFRSDLDVCDKSIKTY